MPGADGPGTGAGTGAGPGAGGVRPWTRVEVLLWRVLGVVAGLTFLLVLTGLAAGVVLVPVLGDALGPVPVAVLAVLLAALVLALWEVRRRATARRRLEVEAWASSRGWTALPPTTRLTGRWTTPPFRGAPAGVRDVLVGEVEGTRVTSATLLVTRRGLIRWWHVLVVEMPAAFPMLSLEREDAVTRLAVAAGGMDVQFESEVFNRAWRVQTESREFAHAVVHPRLMDRLLRSDTADVGVVVEGRDVVVHRAGATDLGSVTRLAGLAVEVAQALPRWVRDDARARHEALPTTRRERHRPRDRRGTAR